MEYCIHSNYLGLERELDIVLAKNKNLNNAKGKEKLLI